jgi:scyllo-inositol 2-dehydrogenase (NADP+)
MIKLGIIGFGGMAHWHAENAPKTDVVQVVAAYDVDPSRLSEAMERGWRAYEDLESFLTDDEINVVLVATPNHVHRYLATMAMRAGKHVVCEKPVTLSVEDLDEMIRVSRETGRIFTIHQNRRWDKDYRIARKAIETGMIGRPISIESRVVGSNGILHGWRSIREYGGGMVYDWGVHIIDQILDMYPDKKITSVFCRTNSIFNMDVDDYDKIILTFEDGMVAQLEVNMYSMEPMPRWYVVGDVGTLKIDGWDCAGCVTQSAAMAKTVAPVIVQTEAGPTRSMAPQPEETKKRLPLPEVETSWLDFYRNLNAVVEGREELIVKPEQARRVLRVIEMCFESAKGNCCVSCEL